MGMKWKRLEPGHYTCGAYHVKGVGTNWDLYRGRKHLHSGASKKECQQVAGTDHISESEPEPKPVVSRSTGFQPSGTPTLDDLHGVMVSLYLEMTHVSAAVAQLAQRVGEETDSRDKLTNAVLLLAKHVGKLGK